MAFVNSTFPRVIAHRGWSGNCPENTLPSFGAAAALGVHEIEFDLWGSRDHELVVCHDPAIDRTSDRRGLIRDLTWPEIQQADAGRWFHENWSGVSFCRFEDILDQNAGRVMMNIHIKSAGAGGWVVERVRDLVEACRIEDQVYITGDGDIMEQAIKLAPKIARCCLEGNSDWTIVGHAVRFGCRRLQFNRNYFNRDMIDQAHRSGLICNLYYSDDGEEAPACLAMGIDAVLSNFPNRILPALQKNTP